MADFLTIDGTPIPIAEGGVTERILRAGGLSRTWPGYLRSSIRWEISSFVLRTPLLTNAEATNIRRLTALGREVTCAGSIIDVAGGTLKCRVLVTDGTTLTTQASDDGSNTMRTLGLEIHPVNEPLLFAYVPGRSLSDATFTRASTATYRNASGLLSTDAINVARDRHYALRNGGLTYERALLLEGGRTNSIVESSNLTLAPWAGAAAVAQNAIGIFGAANAATTLTDSSPTVFQERNLGVTVPNDSNPVTAQFWIAKDADETRFPQLRVTLSGGTAQQRSVSLNTATGANASANTTAAASSHRVRDEGAWWAVEITVYNNGTGNTNAVLTIYPASRSSLLSGEAATVVGAIKVGYVGLEINAPFASSPIPTAGSAIARATDVMNFPAAPPQERTQYFKFIEHGTILTGAAQGFLEHMGSAAGTDNPRFAAYQAGGFYRAQWIDSLGVAQSTATLLVAPALNDLVEIRIYTSKAGRLTIEQSINEGPSTSVTGAVPTAALPAAWAGPEMHVGRRGNSNLGFNAFLSIKDAAGLKSMTQMRALAPVS